MRISPHQHPQLPFIALLDPHSVAVEGAGWDDQPRTSSTSGSIRIPHAGPGKTTSHTDTYRGRFVKLPNERSSK